MTTENLAQIVWDEEKNAFMRRDTNTKVREATPIGPLSCEYLPAGTSLMPAICTLAKKYIDQKPNAYEMLITATDVDGNELCIGDDIYAFRLYKIS